MAEKNQIFRQSSLERISSPEDLNDYVRVANPSVWTLMAAIIILLVGFCVWGIFGNLETRVDAVCVSEGGRTVFYVSEEVSDTIAPGMVIECEDEKYTIASVSKEAFNASEVLSEFVLHLGGFRNGQWVYEVLSDGDVPEGVYPAKIVIESQKPMSFVLN